MAKIESKQIESNPNFDTAIIGGTTLDSSAQFQIDSTDSGFLPPRMTTTEKNAISSPATGLVVYDTTEDALYLYNGTAWVEVGNGALTPINTNRLFSQFAAGTFTPSFQISTGTNRFIIFAISTDNWSGSSWSKIEYGERTMRHIPFAYQSWDNNVLDCFYLMEEDLVGLPLLYSGPVTITFTNQPDSASKMGYVWTVYENVDQPSPFTTYNKKANTGDNPIVQNIENCSIDDHVVAVGFNDFDTGTVTVSSPFTKRIQAVFSTAKVFISDAVATTTTTTYQHSSTAGAPNGMLGFGLRGLYK